MRKIALVKYCLMTAELYRTYFPINKVTVFAFVITTPFDRKYPMIFVPDIFSA